jgi:hypothetical protein
MSATLAFAIGSVRAWTWIYTSGMDPATRDDRRAEIESDLWEFHEDARRGGATPIAIAAHMLLRLVLGVGSDLLWRAEQARLPQQIARHALWVTAAASVALVWWLASAVQALEPPQLGSGINVFRLVYPSRPVFSRPPAPPMPREFARLRNGFRIPRRLPPPPPPPPPEPAWR